MRTVLFWKLALLTNKYPILRTGFGVAVRANPFWRGYRAGLDARVHEVQLWADLYPNRQIRSVPRVTGSQCGHPVRKGSE